MDLTAPNEAVAREEFGSRVKSAVFWRSGTQILGQPISWGATLAVIRILEPSDYGLFAMTSVVLVCLNFLNGYGFVSALIQSEKVEPIRIRQAFGMLILLNAGLAAIQFFAVAPLAAFTVYQARPHIGFTLTGLATSVLPGLTAAAAMAALVWAADQALPETPTLLRLVLLVAVGGLSYTAMLWLGARQTFMEVVNLVFRRKPPEPATL